MLSPSFLRRRESAAKNARRRRAGYKHRRLALETLERRELLAVVPLPGDPAEDDRYHVTDLSLPFLAIGEIVSTFPDGSTREASGAMVRSPSLLDHAVGSSRSRTRW